QVVLGRCLPDPAVEAFAGKLLSELDGARRALFLEELGAAAKPVYRGRAATATGLDVAFLRTDDVPPGRDPFGYEPVRRALAARPLGLGAGGGRGGGELPGRGRNRTCGGARPGGEAQAAHGGATDRGRARGAGDRPGAADQPAGAGAGRGARAGIGLLGRRFR